MKSGGRWKARRRTSPKVVREVVKVASNEVRQAIEVWRKIDDFSGAKTAKEKNKRERLQDVANALFHYCSLSVHTDHHISHWTRADAILALASLCSLLSARDP